MRVGFGEGRKNERNWKRKEKKKKTEVKDSRRKEKSQLSVLPSGSVRLG